MLSYIISYINLLKLHPIFAAFRNSLAEIKNGTPTNSAGIIYVCLRVRVCVYVCEVGVIIFMLA